MPNTLVRIYDNFSAAEHAREALLTSGFSDDEVHLTAHEDEAGAVRSNFSVGNGLDESGKPENFSKSSFMEDDTTYQRDYAEPAPQYGSFLLTVETGDDEQRHRASDIMDRFGAINVEQRISGHKGGS